MDQGGVIVDQGIGNRVGLQGPGWGYRDHGGVIEDSSTWTRVGL